ncbi:MAG: signal peptidase I [Acidobacteriota bacterium]
MSRAADSGAAVAPTNPSPGGDQVSKGSGFVASVWREWLKPLLIIGVVMFSFRSAVADWNDVPTGSMKPTIIEGDRIFVNKVAYDLKVPFTTLRLAQWDDPRWGDVVVLRSPEDRKRLVKRVVGLPGDYLSVQDGYLIRNGVRAEHLTLSQEIVDEIAAAEQSAFYFAEEELGGRGHPIMVRRTDAHARHGIPAIWGPYRVPDDQYFVMGDNRSHSKDSRVFGTVHRSQILGEATAVALSFEKRSFWDRRPRWGRFFSKLQ